jgi:predicted RNase H-like HicB family nuclease
MAYKREMLMDLDITFRLRAGIRYDDAAGVHVTFCPALDVYSQGDTEAEARTALDNSVRLYLKICYERSILDNILNARGFSVNREPAGAAPRSSSDGFDGTDGADGADGADGGDGAELIEIREVKPRPEYPHTFTIDVPLHLIQQGHQQGPRSQRGGAVSCPS